jgi:hypothetical protein
LFTEVNFNIHGPNQAIPLGKTEPNSWSSVAPAPMNPNNLEPDWIKDWVSDLEELKSLKIKAATF